MRTFLMGGAAAAALLGLATAASAQTTLPPTYSEGVPSKPLPVQGANNSNNYQPAFLPGGVANPVPGSVVVRLNGRVLAYGYDEGSSFDRTPASSAILGSPAKVQNYGILGFMRLYGGVDGLAANGLKYGAAIEIRINEGPTNGSTANDASSANSRSSTLYVRREFVYFGTPNAGIIRAGRADGVTGIFDNGVTTFQNFDDGGWDGDLPIVIPGNAQVTFPFASQQGAEYDSAKVVYLSPQFAGFDFGVHFAPSNAVDQGDSGIDVSSGTSSNAALNAQGCAVAASGCANLASSGNTNNDAARFKNQYAAGIRYQNKFDDVAVYGYAAYIGSGHVNYTGPLTTATGASTFQQFNGLSLGDFGAAVTYAGFTLGGHYMYGDVNGALALQPKHGAKGEVWLAGAQYALGPLTVGGSYYDYTSQGSPNLVNLSQRHEVGVAGGATYGIAPGISLLVSYLWGTRHQGDFNFQTGAAGTAATINTAAGRANNDTKAQAIAVGTIVKF